MALKRMAEFAGKSTVDRPLGMDGILRRFKTILGMIVHHNDRFLGLAIRRTDTLSAVSFIERMCDDTVIV
jgi:hypothetical protein